MVTNDTVREIIDILQRRSEFIDSILEKPRDTRSLIDELGVSRSTVDRAADELEGFGVIELGPDGFTPTLVGNLILTAYTDFEESVASIASQETEGELPWHTDEERQAALQLVAERIELLACARTPHDKRDLVDELDHSRSTVNRSIRKLEVAGLVEWTPDGYTTTTLGRRAAEQYRTTVATIADILAARDILRGLPKQCAIPPALLAGSDIEQSDETAPYRLPTGMRERIETTDQLRGVLPVLANPRLLDCFHRRVRDETPLELITNHDLFETLTEEFPGPLAEMAATGAYTALVADTPPFGLLLTDTDAGTAVTVIVYLERRSVYGVIHNDTDAAVQWAEEHYEHVRMDATERTTELRGIAPAGPEAGTGTIGLSEVADSERVKREAEGFVQLTPDYFAQREPAPAATGWRAGFGLTDAHAGYALDREYEPENDSGRRNLTNELVERLDEGSDHALIGPPGSGKSTGCKSIACQWYEQGNGAVFYRESGTGTTFDSRAALGAHLRAAAADGHVLVVVEDAVRAEANAVFRLMRAFRGNQNVTFLLDAREGEWADPTEFPADARLDAYRTESIETVTMPALDEPEVERFIDQFDKTVDHEIDATAEQLLRAIDSATTDEQEQEQEQEQQREQSEQREQATNRPHDLLLLLYWLTFSVNPLAGDGAKTPTVLMEDVQRTYADLRDASDLVLDVGVLVNLLNIAGIGVHPEYVSALVTDRQEQTTIQNVLAQLDGRIIFQRDHGTESADAYRTVHETWSSLFLDHLLDAEDTRTATERFGRCVTALFSLVDDDQQRERVKQGFVGEATRFDDIESTPTEWADTTVERIFHVGLERPRLAPLFGTIGHSRVEIPDACSPPMSVRCAEWRGRMYLHAGELDRAHSEFGRAVALATKNSAISEEQTAEFAASNFNRLGTVANERNEFDAAKDYYTRSLNIHRKIGNTEDEAKCLNNLGTLVHLREDFDAAEEYYTQCLAIYREVGNRRDRANTLHNLGVMANTRGNLDVAEEHYSECLDIYREVGGQQDRAETLVNLSSVATTRGDLTAAEEYAVQCIRICREIGYRQCEAHGLHNRGEIARIRGDFDTAEEYITRGLGIYRDVDDRWHEAEALNNLGKIACNQDAFDSAEEFAMQGLDLYREIEHSEGEATSRRLLGMIARGRDTYETAEDHLFASLALCREIGDRHHEAKTVNELGELAHSRDDSAHAREQFEDAVELFRAMGAVRDAIDALVRLSEICAAENDLSTAVSHCESAQQLVQEADFELAEKHAMLNERHEELVAQTNQPD